MVKYSRQRELVKQAVMEHAIHPTAEEVYLKVREKDPNISMGTVYRNLNMLAEHGIIKRVESPQGPDHFDGRTDEHFHMHCNHCGRVSDIEIPGEALENAIAMASDQHITNYVLSIYGICNACYIKSTNP